MSDNILKLNLQQQVEKNKNDILNLKGLAVGGIYVQYVVAREADLPTEDVEVGSIAAVGSDENYNLFTYTSNEEWVLLGQFPQPGPQGEQGAQGVPEIGRAHV